MFSRRTAFITLFSCVAAACATDLPLVEGLDGGEWRPAPFRVVSMGGQYAAPRVVFVLRLEDPSGRRLTVEGTVEIDPQARLVEGRWVEERDGALRAGTLSSDAVDYYGGQGGRPSLAGRLTLSAENTAVYRINLPRTTLTAER